MRRALRALVTSAIVALGLAGPAAAQQSRFEPNQTRRTASRLEAGDYKNLFCDGEDWYMVDVPAGQRLEASIRFAHPEGDLELELHDSRGRTLAWSKGSQDEEVLALAPAEGMPVFLRVFNAHNTYELHVGFAEGGREPGAEVNCWGSDWYPVAVDAGKELRVGIEFEHARGDLDLAVRSIAGQEELASSAGQADGEAVTWTSEQDQVVLVHVFHVHHSRNVYRIRIRVGEAVPDDLERVFRQERPAGAGEDLIELRTGEVLKGRILNGSFRITTPYTDLEVAARLVAGLDCERRGSEIERLVTVHDDVLSGFVRTRRIRFRLEGFDRPVEIARERVVRVVFGRRGEERAGRARGQSFVLKSGDRFDARLLNRDGWTLDLGFGTIPLDLAEVQSVSFEDGGVATVVRRDQSSARGEVSVDALEVALDVGGEEVRFSLHPDRVGVLHMTPTADTGRLSKGQLRHLLRQLAGEVPRDLLRDLLEGEEVVSRLQQLRGMIPERSEGNATLERHVLAVEDLEERYAWFEILLRIDESVRDRLVRVVCEPGEAEDLRWAVSYTLIELASWGDTYGPLERCLDSSNGQSIVTQAAMTKNDRKVMEWMMNRLRSWRGGGNRQPSPQDHQVLMKELPRLLDDR